MKNYDRLLLRVMLAVFIFSLPGKKGFTQSKTPDASYYLHQANIKFQVLPSYYSDSLAKACVVLYTNAIHLNPKLWQAYSNRAKCFNYLKQYDNSIADINTALKFTKPPATAPLYELKGEDEYDTGKFGPAAKDYFASITKTTSDEAYLKIAKAYYKAGNKEMACRYYTKAIKKNPGLIQQKEFLDCK